MKVRKVVPLDGKEKALVWLNNKYHAQPQHFFSLKPSSQRTYCGIPRQNTRTWQEVVTTEGVNETDFCQRCLRPIVKGDETTSFTVVEVDDSPLPPEQPMGWTETLQTFLDARAQGGYGTANWHLRHQLMLRQQAGDRGKGHETAALRAFALLLDSDAAGSIAGIVALAHLFLSRATADAYGVYLVDQTYYDVHHQHLIVAANDAEADAKLEAWKVMMKFDPQTKIAMRRLGAASSVQYLGTGNG